MQYQLLIILQSAVDDLQPGEQFTLPSLLGNRWEKMSSPDGGGQIGKDFKEAVRSGVDIKGVKVFNDKISPAIYEKKGDRR